MLAEPSPWIYLVTVRLKPDADVVGFNKWYDELHGPALLSVPGDGSASMLRTLWRGNAVVNICPDHYGSRVLLRLCRIGTNALFFVL